MRLDISRMEAVMRERLARVIFIAQWASSGLEFSRRKSDWRSLDARKAADAILEGFDVKPKQPH
jgi:hypothetical protein